MDKEYIVIEANYLKSGTVIPIAFIDDDGISHDVIAKRVVKMETTKQHGIDWRYDVEIDGIPQQIFFEFAESYTQPRRWYRVNNS